MLYYIYKMPRCPKGSRKNPNTGVCESKSKSKSKSPPAATRKNKAVSGVKIPKHRIAFMMKFQRDVYGDGFSEEQYAQFQKNLESFRFKRSDVNADPGFWSNTVITYEGAQTHAIPESRLF
jgi:hypothetical protein